MFVKMLLHDTEYPTTLICAYAPTNTSRSDVRKKFYSQLETIATPNSWLLGDFNARVGRKLSSSDSAFGGLPSNIVGPYSLKNDITPNSNGSSLLHIASRNNLRHLSSHFRLRDSKRWTWRHPRYRSRAVLDHVFVPSAHMRLILRCFVPSDFGLSSDHRPVICELNFCPRTAPKAVRPPPLDISSLNQSRVKEAFQSEISSVLGETNPEALPSEDIASTIRSVTTNAAQKIIPAKRKPKFPEEFRPETIALINRK